jgi:hypothetical protein
MKTKIIEGNPLNRSERIVCPNCDSIEDAIVEAHQGIAETHLPFEVYVHHCINCGYIILESEWEPFSIPIAATENAQDPVETLPW